MKLVAAAPGNIVKLRGGRSETIAQAQTVADDADLLERLNTWRYHRADRALVFSTAVVGNSAIDISALSPFRQAVPRAVVSGCKLRQRVDVATREWKIFDVCRVDDCAN